tara:strand:+ start:110 stop:940 length:831 start_codon:yes stop_codon:yes gene_type:complete
MYYLCIKTHNKTGLKYLCQTKKKNPYRYLGSGTRWINHLNVHGNDISTEIVGKFKSKKLLVEIGIKLSKKYNVVKSRKWANLRVEEGDGGDTSKFIDYKSMKPMPTGLWKRPDLTNYNQSRINPNKGKKLSANTRKKISSSQKGLKKSEEHKRKLSLSMKGKKQTLEQRLAGSKHFKIVNGEKKSLQQISEETGLSYQLLIQRYLKNKTISYKKLTESSLMEKININGKELSSKEFRKKYKISSQKYYKALKNGLNHLEIIKNIKVLLKDKRKLKN